ncbi:2-hydroxyacyl-CoA dehydratase subunit D [Methanosphaerula palustris]|uniref:2-hydroxyglutaryl-CoA dehydratase D-component n=1 Tax=Methanosphaerula palustris (strain ATCC BAA-1556 / DSM 19958 / E1-9c) TaxID=521011 RepID=B8GH85_METPE|nr:2-hydroxyacyl-CoA dehydratase family protein [Methanosphaerula palustris]ACL16490.1 2-hydroxyglutaryl-CoA dehydratase D-component [Methanosphaerula palustris E1-9c]
MTLETITAIQDAVNRRPAELAEARKNGSKVVGYLCCYIPEEIVHALDLIPVRLGIGGNERLVELGGHYISTQNCVFVRETLGMFLEKENPYVNNSDVVAISTSCMQMFRAAELLKYYAKTDTIVLGVPRNFYTDEGRTYFRNEVRWFAEKLEKLAGKNLDPERLTQSIELFKSIRQKIGEIYTIQAKENSPITWREVSDVIQAGYYLDRDQYLTYLDQLLAEIDLKFKELQADPKPDDRPRIIISGSPIPPGDNKIINLIEEMGGRIVADDLCFGLRPYLDIDVKDATTQGIADAYLDKVPCASLPYLKELETDRRLANLSNLVEQFQPDGMIYHTLRFCDAFTFKGNETKTFLKIPFMELHTEYAGSDIEGVRTRVEAFLEMIRDERSRRFD